MSIRDDQWLRLEPELLGREGCSGRRAINNRNFIDAVSLVVRANIPWSHLPPNFGKWSTAYMRFKRWNEIGLWHHLLEVTKDDRQLSALMRKIADFGDIHSMRIQQRSIRDVRRVERRDAAERRTIATKKPPRTCISEPSWIGLINGWVS